MKRTKSDNPIIKTSDIHRKQIFKMRHRIEELEQQKIIFKELCKNLSQKLECMNEMHDTEYNHREKLTNFKFGIDYIKHYFF